MMKIEHPTVNETDILCDCIEKGNKDAVYIQYQHLVESIIRKIFTRRHIRFTHDDIEELRNDVFVRLFDNDCANLRRYDPDIGMRLSLWIGMITNRTVLNFLREKSINGISERSKRVVADEIFEQISVYNEESRLEAIDMLTRVEAALNDLSSVERLVFKLHFYKGQSLKEIASLMHKPIGTVYTIKCRAIDRLKKLIEYSDSL